MASNFCCNETEPRKLHTPPTMAFGSLRDSNPWITSKRNLAVKLSPGDVCCTMWELLYMTPVLNHVVYRCLEDPRAFLGVPWRQNHFHKNIKLLLILRYVNICSGASGKELTCQWRRTNRCWFDPWVGKIPWRRKWQPTPVFLPGKFHGQRSLAGYSPWDHRESDTTEQLILTN